MEINKIAEKLALITVQAPASARQLVSQADLDVMLDEYYSASGWD
jgi:hypothetical protein